MYCRLRWREGSSLPVSSKNAPARLTPPFSILGRQVPIVNRLAQLGTSVRYQRVLATLSPRGQPPSTFASRLATSLIWRPVGQTAASAILSFFWMTSHGETERGKRRDGPAIYHVATDHPVSGRMCCRYTQICNPILMKFHSTKNGGAPLKYCDNGTESTEPRLPTFVTFRCIRGR